MFTIRDCHDDEIDTLDETDDKGIVFFKLQMLQFDEFFWIQ